MPACASPISLFRTITAFSFLLLSCDADEITLSNTELPVDTKGRPLITGETSVLKVGVWYYYYVNNWGECRPVDCCSSPGGCASCCYVPSTSAFPDACVFTGNHSVVVYRTADFRRWEKIGVALSTHRRPAGIEFRPHVVFNKHTKQYVLWYEDRPHAIQSSGYFVATSNVPEGPFTTVQKNVTVADVPGDFDILVDDDGAAWHVQTTTNDPKAAKGFTVTLLDENFTLPAQPRKSSSFVAPRPAEGPVFFKRQGFYYILGGTTCCACRGGASVYVFRSKSPLGPWHFAGDVGANRSSAVPFDIHDPYAFVTHAQASTVINVEGQYLWLGNQWVTGKTRNSDLLYWTVLNFNENGDIEQIERSESAKIVVSSSPQSIHLPQQVVSRPGVQMPIMTLGTAGYNDSVVELAVLEAHKAGFRSFHTAFDYYNQRGVAAALATLNRSDVFIIAMTSPCIHTAAPPRRNVTDPEACTRLTEKEINETLMTLGVDYVDLLLLHGPSEPFNYTGKCSPHVNALNKAQWVAYTRALNEGQTRSIGVSNFCQSCLHELSPTPSVNQIQWHVGMGSDPENLISWCRQKGIVVQSYSPLAAGAIVKDPLCLSIGRKYGHSGADVGLRWVVQHENTALVVKSHNPVDMEADLRVFDWELSASDMAALDHATSPHGQQDGRPSWGCAS